MNCNRRVDQTTRVRQVLDNDLSHHRCRAILSPLLALAEPIAVLAGLSAKVSWLGVVAALAVGQSISFCLMYVFGEHIVTRWRWLARKFERVNVQEYQHRQPFLQALQRYLGCHR